MDARSFCSKVKFQGESVHLADLTSGISFPEVTSKELIWRKEPPGDLSASVEVRAITWVYKPTQNVKTLKCPGRQETNAEWQRRPVFTAMGKSRMWSLNTEVTWIPLNRQTEVRQFSLRGEKCMGMHGWDKEELQLPGCFRHGICPPRLTGWPRLFWQIKWYLPHPSAFHGHPSRAGVSTPKERIF